MNCPESFCVLQDHDWLSPADLLKEAGNAEVRPQGSEGRGGVGFLQMPCFCRGMGTAVPLSLLMLTLASSTSLRGPAFAAPALGDTFSWDFLSRAPPERASKLLPQVPPTSLSCSALPCPALPCPALPYPTPPALPPVEPRRMLPANAIGLANGP